ncbi:hypothetical protein WR25_19760 [Diploscapter pachys]|uniref:Uncharacterized protein n=1 Tax=Diploscapter pachys TaxID=2018661 RepID=A0A2A2KYC5_9BILA|nr:hypothetical protein WR25_19760 [Diploscapter pachys]
MKELNRVLLYLLAVSCSVAYAGQVHYKIQGHYAGVTAASIYGKEKIRSAFLPEEQKIASKLAEILGSDYSDFYVQYFEIHGEDAGFPTTIYFGYLSTNDQNTRDDLISKIQADKDMMLYFMMSVVSLKVFLEKFESISLVSVRESWSSLHFLVPEVRVLLDGALDRHVRHVQVEIGDGRTQRDVRMGEMATDSTLVNSRQLLLPSRPLFDVVAMVFVDDVADACFRTVELLCDVNEAPSRLVVCLDLRFLDGSQLFRTWHC